MVYGVRRPMTEDWRLHDCTTYFKLTLRMTVHQEYQGSAVCGMRHGEEFQKPLGDEE